MDGHDYPQTQPTLALFSLIPTNERATNVTKNISNAHLVSYFAGSPAIDVGHFRSKSGTNTLATLGRQGDIIITDPSISRIHCSFEIRDGPEPGTKHVMFVDKSPTQTCKVSGSKAFGLRSVREPGGPRQVLVRKSINTIIGMGGAHQNLLEFRIHWHPRQETVDDMIKTRATMPLLENPATAATIDMEGPVPQCRVRTRIHTPANCNPIFVDGLPMRIAKSSFLGKGAFGFVYNGIDVDSGRTVAVKVIHKPGDDKPFTDIHHFWTLLKREIENMGRCKHQNIVEFFGSQEATEIVKDKDSDTEKEIQVVEIYMGLMKGSVRSLLADKERTLTDLEIANNMFIHMLQALDYLQNMNLVHRDLKPENILYTTERDVYTYKLADFGLSNHQSIANSVSGTSMFMAPEIFSRQHGYTVKQTGKADVWSLFVTVAWVLNLSKIRERKNLREYRVIQRFLDKVIKEDHPAMDLMREMAVRDPSSRATAAQMLVKARGESGLTTPRHKVPLLGQVGVVEQTTTAPGQIACQSNPVLFQQPNQENDEDGGQTCEEEVSAGAFGKRPGRPARRGRLNRVQKADPKPQARKLPQRLGAAGTGNTGVRGDRADVRRQERIHPAHPPKPRYPGPCKSRQPAKLGGPSAPVADVGQQQVDDAPVAEQLADKEASFAPVQDMPGAYPPDLMQMSWVRS